MIYFAEKKKTLRIRHHLELLKPRHRPDVGFSMTDPGMQASNHPEGGTAWMTKANGDQEIDDRF